MEKRDNRAREWAVDPDSMDDELVFVAASFAPDMEPIFQAISAAAQVVGLRAERVKDVKGDYRIPDKIFSMIERARLVVADLTHARPNVYFELGYARKCKKTVITILRKGTVAHFDVQDWTRLEYFDSRPLESDLVERFKFELQNSA
jgi:nucleoside 2-deoxyribosyltransferase